MAATYDVYESPTESNDKKNVHVRLVTDGTIETEVIAQQIQFSSTLTIGDVEAVLSALSHHVTDMLREGKRVHIKGLGYFQMTMKCPPVKSAAEVKGNMIKFKSVSFRPENDLKKELQEAKFIRSDRKNIHSPSLSDKKIENLLAGYFETHEFITRLQFERLCFFTRSTATNRLNKLVETGKLKKKGGKNFFFYEPIRIEE